MINNKFIHYETQAAYEANKENISEDSIVFVKDKKSIYTHGGQYGTNIETPVVQVSPDGQSIIISYDSGETWYPLIKDFNKIRIIGYIDSLDQLPKNANVGDIYGVWNSDANQGQGAYEMYINTIIGWEFDADILKVYEYETELPVYATDSTIAVIPQKNLTLDKQKIDGYKVYKYSLANRSWVMILNTSEIFASKEDIINHGDNLFALVKDNIKVIPCVIDNWVNGTLNNEESYVEDNTSIIGTYSLGDDIKVLEYSVVEGYEVDIKIISNAQFNPSEIVSPNVLCGTEGYVTGFGEIVIPQDAKSVIVVMNKIDSQEYLPVNTGEYFYLHYDVINTYKLYKRIVNWIYFGTNASITYNLVQNIDGGTSTNILSGQAVKDEVTSLQNSINAIENNIETLENDLDTRLDNIEQNTLSLTLTPSPNKVFYKDTEETIVFTSRLKDLIPDEIIITDMNNNRINNDDEHIMIGTYTGTLASNNNSFTANASYYDATFTQIVNLQSRYPIYTIFAQLNANMQELVDSMTRQSARTSAAGTYSFINDKQQWYCPFLLVPSDVTQPTKFSMGGAPVSYVSHNETINGVSYTVYRLGSDNGYDINVRLDIVVS